MFIAEWAKYDEDNGVGEPIGIAINSDGEIYVTDMFNDNIQKYTSEGVFIPQWESGDAQFIDPKGIAVDAGGNVYVADTGNNRIQKFDSDGGFIREWGTYGSGYNQFDQPMGIAVDASGNVYVADSYNHRIQKFDSDGGFIKKWGSFGLGDGELYFPSGIDVDETGKVYVGNRGSVQIFDTDGTFITKFGELGSEPGMFGFIHSVYVSSSGRVYTSDYTNKRVQVFKKVTVQNKSKAIIVAGGGAFPGNNLWDATQMSANFAYRTLTYQGFTKESIYYLTSDTDLDLDGNGELDDVDADATNDNLHNAITTWAADAENLVLYLVDHGGEDSFRMSGTETLSASDLDSWLDQLQDTTSVKVTVIYDACESGSFLSGLTPPSGKERVVITSTSPGESAYFVTQGSVSFSNYFWTHIFNGLDIKDAFNLAAQAIGQTANYQHPLLDADGDGTGNETEDLTLVEEAYIGNGTIIYGDAPVIGGVSQTINGPSSATLSAFGVTDDDCIARVWAVIRPPDYSQGSPDNPVQNLPYIDLIPVGGDQYEGTYDGFNIEGTYSIAIYARDRMGNTSVPLLTTVSVNNPLRRRAIIVAGGSQSDEIWPAVEKNTKLVWESLSFQGYSDDDIYLMSPASIPGVTIMTVLPSLSNLGYAITTWARQSTRDVVIYMIGNGGYGTFALNGSETLSASQLDSWLDNLQANISGKVTVIYDASYSGSFLSYLIPPDGKERILISSSSGSQASSFISDGDISFSRFFWSHILNGMNVRDSFINAKNAIYYCAGQTPQLDDNSNGIGNEKLDGLISRYYSIGVGIMLAGDDPVIGSVSPGQTLYGDASATIWAEDVTTTGTIDKVWAVISPPAYVSEYTDTELPTIELVDDGNGHYEGTYDDFSVYGNYTIAVYAMDTDGNVSLPKDTYVFQEIGPDIYEEDDTFTQARVIILDNETAQRHNFHDEGDEDWVKFYGIEGKTYTIEARNLGENCDIVIELYDNTGTNLLETQDTIGDPNAEEFLYWDCPADGVYYIMVKQYEYDPPVFGQDTGYDLTIYHPVAGFPGWLMGIIVNSLGQGIGDAIIKTGVSLQGAITNDIGFYRMQLPSGIYTITASASGYDQKIATGVDILAEGEATQNFVLYSLIDSDDDGLLDDIEAILGTDPNDADTDDDGILDGDEDADHDGVVDANETSPLKADTDGDGIQDGTELGYTLIHIDEDTDTNIFQPDLDPSTKTNPLKADTDGDGKTDGQEDINHNGRVDPGETDPNVEEFPWELFMPAIMGK
jgi:hypothetical protein